MNKSRFQRFIENSVLSFLSLIKIIILSKIFFRNKFPLKSQKDCVVLGNGPSLNPCLENHREFLANKDLFAVNYFPVTDIYDQLKPRNYIVGALEFWYPDVTPDRLEKQQKLFNALATKTTWELNLFISYKARNYPFWLEIIKNNKNIKVTYYNETPTEGFRSFRYCAFRKNLGMPRPHNVMIPAILFSLNMGYDKIYLVGADHSWLPLIKVDDQNNVLLNQQHFYDENTSVYKTMANKGKGQRNLSEVLHKFYLAFKGHMELAEYSKHKGIEIINLTPGSFIDAYQKINLSNLKNA